jgi:hypothetical protein
MKMVSFIRQFPLKLLNYHIWRLTHAAVDGDIVSMLDMIDINMFLK